MTRRQPLIHHEIAVASGQLELRPCRLSSVAVPCLTLVAGGVYSALFWTGRLPNYFEILEKLDPEYSSDNTIGHAKTFMVTVFLTIVCVALIGGGLERIHLRFQHRAAIKGLLVLRRLAREAAEILGDRNSVFAIERGDLLVEVKPSEFGTLLVLTHTQWGEVRLRYVKRTFDYLTATPETLAHIDEFVHYRASKMLQEIPRT